MPQQSNRSELVFLACALLLCAAGLGYAYATAPTHLSLAVGPAGGSDEVLFRAFADELATQRKSLRIDIVPVSDVREAAGALERKRAELAVVRPDVQLPGNGLTVAVMRDAPAVVVAPSQGGLSDLAGLAGKRLGVITNHDGDPDFFRMILRHFALEAPAVEVNGLPPGEAVAALREKKVDAIGVIGAPGEAGIGTVVRDMAKALNGRLAVFGTDIADAIAANNLSITSTQVAAGLWNGRPKLPAEEVKTVGVSYRLMARSDVPRGSVALLAENLFQLRSALATKARSANLMQPPDTDASSTARSLPNHPGAVDYFQRQQTSFMERYGDLLYLVALFGSGLISAAAGLRERFARRRRERIDDVLDRLIVILSEARRAETPERLDEIVSEIDDLLITAVTYARARTTGTRTTSALVLALDGARAAVADRRVEIAPGAPAQAQAPGGRTTAGPSLAAAPEAAAG